MGVKRILSRILVGLLAMLAAVYVGDWTIWRARGSSGMGTVTVGVLIESEMKGNKEEYDWAGRQAVDCSRSFFPQAGAGACWWLTRKGTIEDK